MDEKIEQVEQVESEPINQAVKLRDVLIVFGVTVLFIFCIGKGVSMAININSKYTNIELDAFALASLAEPNYVDGKSGNSYTLVYSNDKITIKSNYREDKYIPRADNLIDPYEKSWVTRPSHRSLPRGWFGDDKTIYIKVWLNTNLWPIPDGEKTLVYSSVLKPYDFCQFGFSQGKVRQKMFFKDGEWIDYLHELTEVTKREAYERLLPQIEIDKLKKEVDRDGSWNRFKVRLKQRKIEAKVAEKLRKASQEVAEPVDDKEFFKK